MFEYHCLHPFSTAWWDVMGKKQCPETEFWSNFYFGIQFTKITVRSSSNVINGGRFILTIKIWLDIFLNLMETFKFWENIMFNIKILRGHHSAVMRLNANCPSTEWRLRGKLFFFMNWFGIYNKKLNEETCNLLSYTPFTS